jgi:hypothetical protein
MFLLMLPGGSTPETTSLPVSPSSQTATDMSDPAKPQGQPILAPVPVEMSRPGAQPPAIRLAEGDDPEPYPFEDLE